MGLGSATKRLYVRGRDAAAHHVRSPDRLAMLANTGATIIWTHLPIYPLLVWWLVGRPVWPSFLQFLAWPLFFAVPFVSRRHPDLSRALFVTAGVANTLLCTKAFGVASGVGWFLLPCLLIAATFFRLREWAWSGALSLFTALCALLLTRLGPPLHAYTAQQNLAFASLNHWCVGGLAAYLLFVAGRRQLTMREAA